MHELIVELQNYHSTKARHLFELEDYVNRLLGKDFSRDAMETLKVLFEPFQRTEDAAHHRNEEAILQELRKTSAPIHRRVDEISGDHDAFERILADIATRLDDETTSCAELCSTIKRFVEIYKDHAAGEESIFFPTAEKYLQEDHWRRIRLAWQ